MFLAPLLLLRASTYITVAPGFMVVMENVHLLNMGPLRGALGDLGILPILSLPVGSWPRPGVGSALTLAMLLTNPMLAFAQAWLFNISR